MTLAILSALPEEQHGLLDLLHAPVCVRHAGRDFWQGTWHGTPVVLALAGIGKVAAATTATVLVERFAAERIVFAGVAGGLGDGVRVGDVVVAQALLQHDMDASPLFPRFEVPLYGRSHFAADAALTAILLEAANAYCAGAEGQLGPEKVALFGLKKVQAHHGLLVAGDRFVATAAESHALRSALPGVLAVDMESAAVAQVCFDYHIPFAAVRTISDRADDAAHVDFPLFLAQLAAPYAQGIMVKFLQLLLKK